MQSFDVAIIGGGTNGLACATRLAQAGRKVVVIEAAPEVGGGAGTVEFAPGFRVSGLAHLLHMLDPRVARGMALERHGLKLAASDLVTAVPGPAPLTMRGVFGKVQGLDPADMEAWQEMQARLTRFAGKLAPFRAMTPPRIARKAGNDMLALARAGLSIRAMGKDEFREFMRLFLINIADVLEDDLTDDRLMGLVAFDTTLGAWAGPRSPNSLLGLLNRISGGARLALPAGGMGSVASAMAKAAQAAGVVILTGQRAAAITVGGDRAVGVRLDSSEEIAAGRVISAICPRTTFARLVGPAHLDTGFLRQARGIRARGGAAKLHLALSGAPEFTGADLRARIVIAPSVDAVETAFNPVKYGEVPKSPVMEIVLPSAHEPGMAPEGQHSLSAIVQFAPYNPADPDAARAEMLANTLAVLEKHAPGIGKLILHAELLMPYDIESRYGMSGGSWHHGDLAAEQMLFLRPFAGVAQYRTPLAGLWLAGAGSHPGGGISGAPGWNAAGALLAEGGQ